MTACQSPPFSAMVIALQQGGDQDEDAVALLATQMNGSHAGANASRTVVLSSTLSGLLLLLIRP